MIQRIGTNARGGLQIEAKQQFHLLSAIDDAGLTQAELARRMRVSPNTVSNWALGKTEVPGAVMAYLILLCRVKVLLD